MMSEPRVSYWQVWLAFARNSLIRDMTFRASFILNSVASLSWVLMNLGYYAIIFSWVNSIGAQAGWEKWQFAAFLATTLFINSLVQTFFMSNMDDFSELIRTGGLDFALLKPIDPQFLISCRKIDWSNAADFIVATVLLTAALINMNYRPPLAAYALYPFYVLCGTAIMYSLMIGLAATSIWLGRNQSLYDYWFYVTNFSRYPMEVYDGPIGGPLRFIFTYVAPILLVVNVPARLLAKPLETGAWSLALYGLLATIACLLLSRWLFMKALASYRSASS